MTLRSSPARLSETQNTDTRDTAMTQTNCLTSLPVSLERDLNILGVRSASSFAVRLTKALPVSSQKTVLDENGNPEF